MTGRWTGRTMGRLGLLLAVVAAVAACAWVWLGMQPRTDATPPTLLLPRTVAVAPGVYLLGGMSPAPAYAVETSEGLALIDSGLDAAAVAGPLSAAGLDLNRLRAVLLTHVHGDHSLGAERLRERTGAKVYAGLDDCRPLRDGGPREAFFSTFHMPNAATHPTTVDVELVGGETIELGDSRFTAIAAPGHTPGSVCYLLERPGLRALFTGDVIQCLDPARQGALGTYAAYLPPFYRGNAADYLASLRRLRELPPPDLVLPGHPQMDAAPQNPRLTPQRWHALLDQGIAEMETLQAHFDADGADFLDGTPRELLPGLHYLGDVGGSAVYCLDTPKGLFLFDAPGGTRLVERLTDRFEALGWKEKKVAAVFLTSADGDATAGLDAVVRSAGCKVVAPRAGLDTVRKACPPETEILTEDDLQKHQWFEGEAIPLQGRGVAPLAYRVQWAGKTVLLTGRIPVKLNAATGPQLLREVAGRPDNIGGYLRSLTTLRELKPELWLPATPVHGQNANVYGDDWSEVLRQNWMLFSQ
jgi:hydroxyacylglutathione hydrolase